MRPMLLFGIITVYLIHSFVAQEDEPTSIGDEDDNDAEVVYNKTYTEHQTQLERAIFSRYSPFRRPVKNESETVDVSIHWHVVHLSVDEKAQTMTVHGHLYMTWKDELLGWDPDEFNGIRITRAQKWRVWNPKVKVANSVSGVYSTMEISSQAHVLLQTLGSKDLGAKVEMYPTFSIRAGCFFDFHDFPRDENQCSIRLYSPSRWNEVSLRVYGTGIPPTINFGWGNQSDKRIISDFEVLDVINGMSFYRHGNLTAFEPITAEESANTWGILELTILFRRHTVLYGIGILLPTFMAIVLNAMPFFMKSISHAIYTLTAGLLIQVVFLQDLVEKIPLAVSSLPAPIWLYGETLITNCIALTLHILFLIVSQSTKPPPKWLSVPATIRRFDQKEIEGPLSWRQIVSAFRPVIGIVFACFGFATFLTLNLM